MYIDIMEEKKAKLGRAFKRGEPTVPVTVRIPESVWENIPEPKRENIAQIIIKKFKEK